MAEAGGNKKGTYGKWSEQQMEAALASFKRGDQGLNATCELFSIPKPTFKRHLLQKNKIANGSTKRLGRTCTLTDQVEKKLVETVLLLQQHMFGITRMDLMSLAFEIAEQNSIPHVFNKEKKKAGKMWYTGFLRRHPELCLRQPEPTSKARKEGFNRQADNHFFELYEKVLEENEIDSTRVYNVDEAGLSTVHKPPKVIAKKGARSTVHKPPKVIAKKGARSTVHKPPKVIAKKGARRVGATTSGERGVNTTVVCCVSAAGNYVPPLVLFKRKRMHEALKEGAPPGSLVTSSKSGWMDQTTVVEWLKHFINHVRPSQEKPVVLILDGHSAHTKNLEAIELAKLHGIIMISLPPHTTHRMQPLDVAFFKPLKCYFNQAAEQWMRSHPGSKISAFNICSLFSTAYMKAATMPTAVRGFSRCGIWPCSRDVFEEHDFLPSDGYASPPPLPVPPRPTEAKESSATPPVPPRPDYTSPSQPPPLPPRAPCPPPRPPKLPKHPEKFPSSCPQANIHSSQSSQPAQICPQQPSCPCAPAPERHIGPPTLPGKRSGDEHVSAVSTEGTIIIPTASDGRCFFRSVCISLQEDLQSADRDVNGYPSQEALDAREEILADNLRGQTMKFMLENLHTFDDIEGDGVCADMPRQLSFKTMTERLKHMAKQTSLPGEFEVMATSKVLERPIHVHNMSSGYIRKYGEEFHAQPVSVAFTRVNEHAGHYQAIIPNADSTADPGLSADFRPVAVAIPTSVLLPTVAPSQNSLRAKKTSRAEILTASPYKDAVAASKRKISAKQTMQKKKTKASREKPEASSDRDWFCFMCSEARKEDMIQCCSCQQWVHEACANTDVHADLFFCEFCK